MGRKQPDSKAIAYFANGIGNFLMMTPALQALSELVGSPVDLMVSSHWDDPRKRIIAELCSKWAVIGRVINYPGDNFSMNYDHWFIALNNSLHGAQNLFLDRAKTPPVPVPDWGVSLIHERDFYMDHLYGMGYSGPPPAVNLPIPPGGPQLPRGAPPTIALCNGSFGTAEWRKKRWAGFRTLADTLHHYLGARCIGVGGDAKELEGVDLDTNFAGKLTLLETAKVLSQCDLAVTTDTGCMHLADTGGVPLVALFGPTLISKNGPRISPVRRIVRSRAVCAPCFGNGVFYRCEYNACMEAISVGDVMGEVITILEEVL